MQSKNATTIVHMIASIHDTGCVNYCICALFGLQALKWSKDCIMNIYTIIFLFPVHKYREAVK